MNTDRALSVIDFLLAFADEQGLTIEPDGDGPETVFSDMLCNMLHWLSQEIGIEQTVQALQNGISAFAVEFGSEDEVNAEGEANVTLKITGWGGSEDGKRVRFKIDAHPSGRLVVDGFVAARSRFAVLRK
jgi:hypothetical protein